MKEPSNQFERMYDLKAGEYVESKKRFFSGKADDSRKNLLSLLGEIKGKRILELGCGTGDDAHYFASMGADVSGVDISTEMVNIARRSYPGLDFRACSFDRTGFEQNSFDLIYSRYALHYSTDLAKVYIEIHRVLKKGGRAALLVSHPLLGFVAKKRKDYHAAEVVDIPIFDGNFVIQEPTHTFSEYINESVLSLFDLAFFYEQPGEEKANVNNFKETVPDYLLLAFVKK